MKLIETFFRVLATLPWVTWLGLTVGFVAAIVSPVSAVCLSIWLLTLLATVLVYDRRVKDAVEDLPSPVTLAETKVQPEGPTFQDVLRVLPEPVLVISGKARDVATRPIVFANTAAEQAFGAIAVGKMLVSAIRQPEVLHLVDEALFNGVATEAPFVDQGAQARLWRAYATPLESADEGLKLALLVLRDETEVRRIEKMRADFLANASHELRSPLASLTGYIETLRGPAKGDAQAAEKFLDIMAVQADRMGRLISDLLSLSRIELNEHIPPTQATDMAAVLAEVVQSLRPIAEKKDVALSIYQTENTATICGDRDQITQVIQNLIDNALKYAPPKSEVSIRLLDKVSQKSALQKPDNGASRLALVSPDRKTETRFVALSVTDFGPGIARANLPRLSERFYRVEGQKSGAKLGTGLGLAIVKHIVNRHRGGLIVESLARTDEDDALMSEVKRSDRAKDEAQSPTYTQFTVYFPEML